MIPGIIAQQADVSSGGGGDYFDDVAAAWGVSGIAAIYSLRKTVPEYAGPVVKGLRSSDSATMDFYPTDDDWLDVAELATWAGSSTVTVETWYDQSGNSRDMTAPYTNPPHLVTAGSIATLNGRPSIRFAGASSTTRNRLQMPFTFFDSPHTLVAAMDRTISNGTGNEWGSIFSMPKGTRAMGYGFNSARRVDLQQTGVSDKSAGALVANNEAFLMGWRAASAWAPSTSWGPISRVYGVTNPVHTLSFNSDTKANNWTAVGGVDPDAYTGHLAGHISEIVIHLTSLSDSDYRQIEDVIHEKAGFADYGSLAGRGNRLPLIGVTATGITVSSGAFSNFVNGYKIADSTGGFVWNAATGTGADYITFEFASACTIKGFQLYHSSTLSQGSWNFEGSNDNSSWTNLLSFTFNTLASGVPVPYVVPNSDPYKYYRLRHMSGNRVTTGTMEEIEFYAEYPNGDDTSWFSAISSGNRSSIITATSSGITFTSGTVSSLINGTLLSDCYWATATGTGVEYLLFDFGGTARKITGVRLLGSADSVHGVWLIEASDDNATWTTIVSSFTFITNVYNLFENPTEFRYYRLRHMSGNRVNSPYLYDIEFRAA